MISVDFQVKVLTTGSWPYKTSNNLKLPKEVNVLHRMNCSSPWNPCSQHFQLEACRDRFLNYYQSKHNGRKISWIWTQCRGDIKYTPAGSSNSYVFTVSLFKIVEFLLNKMQLFQTTTHQMAILLMFNEADELSVNEILAGTEIETENDYLFKVLSTLLKVKLLVCKNRSINEDELVSLEDTVTCNHKYKRYLSWRVFQMVKIKEFMPLFLSQ